MQVHRPLNLGRISPASLGPLPVDSGMYDGVFEHDGHVVAVLA